MTNRIVVIGGSFNPPTITHLELMQAAVDMIDGRVGIFVPTSYDYVAKKLKRQKCPQDTLSDAIRLEMLKSLCNEDDRLTVSQIQMNRTERGYDYEMLIDLQKEYTDDELYFVTSSDKLYVLSRWHRINELLRGFHVLVAKRGEDDLEQIKQIRPILQSIGILSLFFQFRMGLVRSVPVFFEKGCIEMTKQPKNW